MSPCQFLDQSLIGDERRQRFVTLQVTFKCRDRQTKRRAGLGSRFVHVPARDDLAAAEYHAETECDEN